MALTTDQPTAELGEINLLDRDVFASRVPHEWFATLRQQAPAYLHPEPNGPGFWVFTRHEEVMHLNRDWQTGSSDGQRGGVVQGGEAVGGDVEDVGHGGNFTKRPDL
jgi:cytochrome P450